MINQTPKIKSGKLILLSLIITVFIINAVIMNDIQKDSKNNYYNSGYSTYSNYFEGFSDPVPTGIVDNPILSPSEQSLITGNNQIANTLAAQIIDSITSGTFYYGRWEPSLESMCEGLSVLKWLNAINILDADRFANYIMAQFNAVNNLFIDSSTGFTNYSYSTFKVSTSPIESTAYAIISLDTLNKLDRLNTAQKSVIVTKILSAVNQYDGGFCHRIDGVKPKGYENSSIRLSYWMYTALDILQPNALTSEQLNNLTTFVKNQQIKNMGSYILDGSFKDSYWLNAASIETCYYAVKLLQKLGKLAEINLANLRAHIETLYDAAKGGVYEDYLTSKLIFKTPEYFATACALAINSVIGGIAFDPSVCETMIVNNFNQTLGYWRTFTSSNISLLHTSLFLVVQPFYESGRSFSSTIRTKILAGMADFYVFGFDPDLGAYWNAIMPLGRRHGSISYLAEKIKYLDAVGKLSSLTTAHKNAIYSYVKSCVYVNKSNLAHTFQEFPDFSTSREITRYCANMVEFSYIPYNETSLARFGRGIAQTKAALDILILIGKLSTFNAEKNLNNYAIEILNCQIKSGLISVGAFVPHSSILFLSTTLIHKFSTQSVPRCADAVECLQIIDAHLGSSYLSQIDSAKLKGFLESWRGEIATEEYFSDIIDEGREDPTHAIEITDCIVTLDETLSMGIVDSEDAAKIVSWIGTHGDNCQLNDEYDFAGASHYINLLYTLGGDIGIPERLSHFRTVFNNYLGSVSANRHINLLDRGQINMLTCLNDERISEVKFLPSTGIFAQVKFQPVFEVYVAGVYTLNFQSHALQCRITASDATHSDWIAFTSIDTGSKYRVTIPEDMAFEYYPQFTCEIKDTNTLLNLRNFSYVMNANINHVADVQQIVNNRQSFKGQTLVFKVGLYLHSTSGAINIAIEHPSINITIRDAENTVISSSTTNDDLCVITEEEEGGINWVQITVNSTGVLGDYTVVIEIGHELLVDNSTVVDTGDLIPIEFSKQAAKYTITVTGKIIELTNPQDYALIAFGSVIALAGGAIALVQFKRRRPEPLKPNRGTAEDDFDDEYGEDEYDEHGSVKSKKSTQYCKQNFHSSPDKNKINQMKPVTKTKNENAITKKAEPNTAIESIQGQLPISKLQAIKTQREINKEESIVKVKDMVPTKPLNPILPSKVKNKQSNPKVNANNNVKEEDRTGHMAEIEDVSEEIISPKQEIVSKLVPHVEAMRQRCSNLAENIHARYTQSDYIKDSPYFSSDENELDPDAELKLFGQDMQNDYTTLRYSTAEKDEEVADLDLSDEEPIIQSKRLGITFTDKQIELYSKED